MPKCIYYNFKLLPLSQAKYFPIFINKGKISGNGRIVIENECRPGMIKLGFNTIPLLPNNGVHIINNGTIIFKGRCSIGNASVISIDQKGKLFIGNNVAASAGLNVICHNRITLFDMVLLGWSCTLMDTDLHKLTNVNGGGYSKGYGCIEIGENCWLANNCKVYKNVKIPCNCVIASDTILCKTIECEPYSLLGNDRTVKILKTGVLHDWNNDKVTIDDNEA